MLLGVNFRVYVHVLTGLVAKFHVPEPLDFMTTDDMSFKLSEKNKMADQNMDRK